MRRSLSSKSEPTIFYQMIQFVKNWIPMGFFGDEVGFKDFSICSSEVFSMVFPIIKRKNFRVEHTVLCASIKDTND